PGHGQSFSLRTPNNCGNGNFGWTLFHGLADLIFQDSTHFIETSVFLHPENIKAKRLGEFSPIRTPNFDVSLVQLRQRWWTKRKKVDLLAIRGPGQLESLSHWGRASKRHRPPEYFLACGQVPNHDFSRNASLSRASRCQQLPTRA